MLRTNPSVQCFAYITVNSRGLSTKYIGRLTVREYVDSLVVEVEKAP